MNIGSGNKYPANALSNFAPHPFVFDGVQCNSMEGFLQSLKFDKAPIQESVCLLVGRAAKMRGKKRNKTWKSAQCLWWKGLPIKRNTVEYQHLLQRAYNHLYIQNKSFRQALKASGKAVLKHTIGSGDAKNTVITVSEFCTILTNLRDNVDCT